MDKKKKTTKEQAIASILHDKMSESDLIDVWNEFCEANSWDDTIRDMSSFDDYMEYRSASEVVEMTSYSFSLHDDYFVDTLGEVTSSDEPWDFIDEIELIEWLAERADSSNTMYMVYDDEMTEMFIENLFAELGDKRVIKWCEDNLRPSDVCTDDWDELEQETIAMFREYENRENNH